MDLASPAVSARDNASVSDRSGRDDRDDAICAVDLAGVAHALAHPARVAIVRRLAEDGPLVMGDIVIGSSLAQSTVSEHLRILREAEIVTSHREGSRVRYRLALGTLTDFVCRLVDVADVAELPCLAGD